MPHTLLLADDSVTIQRVIELTFADEDIRVVAVSDGDQAIAMLDANPPDIVLADAGMPGRDGYQVAEYIKSTPRLAHIPVLLLTGAFDPIDQARIADIGCDGVLAKPFEPQLVIGRVKELLAKPKASPAIPGAPPIAPTVSASNGGEPAAARGRVGPANTPEDVDRYFDRLDRAFANLSNSAKGEPTSQDARPAVQEIDWFSTVAAPTVPPPDLPLAEQAGPTPFDAADDLRVAPPPAAHAEGLAAEPRVLPQLADAFAALLAAEQSSATAAPTGWPAPAVAQPETAADPRISDDVINDIVRRVLERMSDRAVREIVTDIASDTTERLVREEIDRITKKFGD